jgi:hypothetical protein
LKFSECRRNRGEGLEGEGGGERGKEMRREGEREQSGEKAEQKGESECAEVVQEYLGKKTNQPRRRLGQNEVGNTDKSERKGRYTRRSDT